MQPRWWVRRGRDPTGMKGTWTWRRLGRRSGGGGPATRGCSWWRTACRCAEPYQAPLSLSHLSPSPCCLVQVRRALLRPFWAQWLTRNCPLKSPQRLVAPAVEPSRAPLIYFPLPPSPGPTTDLPALQIDVHDGVMKVSVHDMRNLLASGKITLNGYRGQVR